MSDDERPVAWRGMASCDCNDDPFLCPRPAGSDYYPGPGKPRYAWEEDLVIDPKTMTLKRPDYPPGARPELKPMAPQSKPKGRPFAKVRAILQRYKDTK